MKWWHPVLVVGAIATASLADGAVNDWVQERRTPQSDDLARIFRYGGELATSLSNEIKNGWVSAALYTFATDTAWSRLNDQRHWLSDVLAGATVGITAATIVDRHPPRLLAEPSGAIRLEWRIAF